MYDRRICFALLGLILLLTSCSIRPVNSASSGLPPLAADDVRWLNRVTFGIDTATATRYRQVGRARFLSEQLQLSTEDPPTLAAAIAAIPVSFLKTRGSRMSACLRTDPLLVGHGQMAGDRP
jgi:hypothetical protein